MPSSRVPVACPSAFPAVADPSGVRVVLGAPYWSLSGVNVFSANLARGLRQLGVDARILFTEQATDLVTISEPLMPARADIPFEALPVDRRAGWGAHWGAMLRYLEERAPCVYVPNSDFRHSGVAPLLSERVKVVGVVHSDDPFHYDHVSRLGKYWNAIACVSRAVAERTATLEPDLAPRIVTIPIGVDAPTARPERPVQGRRADDPLRLVYQGLLIQRQKRVLDLPLILEALGRRGVPATLDVFGSGSEELVLREACRPFGERVRFHGVVSHPDLLRALEERDVLVMTSEFEGMPNALLEAMGRGCVPVVTRTASGIPELIRDGENGLLVPIGDVEAFAERLEGLHAEPDRREALSRAAHETVRRGPFTVDRMVGAYLALFERALAGPGAGPGPDPIASFRRPSGPFSLPPPRIEGVGIFPVDRSVEIAGVGAFPSHEDARAFERARRPRLSSRFRAAAGFSDGRPERASPFRVIVTTPHWALSGVNVFNANLVRGLLARGVDARILLTEQDTHLISIPETPLPRPDDVPFELLPVGREEGWGAHWGTMLRYLEEQAPCVYLPNYDWRHSCVTPLLSKGVAVVGIAHSDDPLHYDHVARLGSSWNATVAVSRTVAARIAERHPELAPRLATIPYGVGVPERLPERDRSPGRPLRLVYHGVLNEWQKRILDLPRILGELGRRGVPATLRVAGTGPEEAALREACRPFGEAARFEGVLPNAKVVDLLAEADVFLMTSGFEGMPHALLEAMGNGCIPVVTRIESGIPELVCDGGNGYVVPIGGVAEFGDRLARLQQDVDLRERLSRNARATVLRGAYTIDDMVLDYLHVFRRAFQDARSRRAPARPGPLNLPPPHVDGIGLFPVERRCPTPWGRFPRWRDVAAFIRSSGTRRMAAPALGLVARRIGR